MILLLTIWERPLHVTVKIFNAQKLRLQSLELSNGSALQRAQSCSGFRQSCCWLWQAGKPITTPSTVVCVPQLQLEQRPHLALKKKLWQKIRKQMWNGGQGKGRREKWPWDYAVLVFLMVTCNTLLHAAALFALKWRVQWLSLFRQTEDLKRLFS